MGILENHFMSSDKEKAKNELLCMTHCLEKSTALIENEQYEKAIAYMENVLRSLKELQRLNLKKQQREKIQCLVNQLGSQNVNVVLFRRDKRENNYY